MKQIVLLFFFGGGGVVYSYTFCCRLISPNVLAVGAAQTAVVTVDAAGVTSDAVQTLTACCAASTGLTN